jgi:hypothetical protein
MTFQCQCGKTIDYPGEGAYNVGLAEKSTGWHYGTCQYTQKSVWLCPDCWKRARALAHELFALVESPYYYWTSLIGKEVVDEWCKKEDAKRRQH